MYCYVTKEITSDQSVCPLIYELCGNPYVQVVPECLVSVTNCIEHKMNRVRRVYRHEKNTVPHFEIFFFTCLIWDSWFKSYMVEIHVEARWDHFLVCC
jgi:hypothetical protein